MQLFTNHEASKVLSEEEIAASVDYLSKYVKPFSPEQMKSEQLSTLVRQSTVIELEADETMFSHNIDYLDTDATVRNQSISA